MVSESTVNIAFVLVAFQFLITCVFFYEKNPHVRGIKSLALSAFALLAAFSGTMIFSKAYPAFEQLANAIFFAISYYFLCRAFIQVLNLRSVKRLENYWLIFTIMSCAAISIFDLNPDLKKVYAEILIGIIPIAYLLYLLEQKARTTQYFEELAYLSYALMLILLVRLIYIGTYAPSELIPQMFLQHIPETLNSQFKFVCEVTILFVHLSLVIAFLMLVFRLKEIELKKMGDTDALTGVYNRKAFFEQVSNNPNQSESYFIMIDADFFKNINDSYGHIAGDEALKHIAKVVSSCISEDDMLARYGGEEFIIAVSDCNEKDVKNIAERICLRMENTPLSYNDININITLSIGVTKCQSDDSLQDIERADKMLYQAKRNGRNQAVYCFS